MGNSAYETPALWTAASGSLGPWGLHLGQSPPGGRQAPFFDGNLGLFSGDLNKSRIASLQQITNMIGDCKYIYIFAFVKQTLQAKMSTCGGNSWGTIGLGSKHQVALDTASQVCLFQGPLGNQILTKNHKDILNSREVIVWRFEPPWKVFVIWGWDQKW